MLFTLAASRSIAASRSACDWAYVLSELWGPRPDGGALVQQLGVPAGLLRLVQAAQAAGAGYIHLPRLCQLCLWSYPQFPRTSVDVAVDCGVGEGAHLDDD